MAEDQVETQVLEEDSEAPAAPRRRRWSRWPGLLALLVLLTLLAVWLLRKDIADDVISAELEKAGLPATYEVHRIVSGGQVLRNLVIGDPKHPDLTVEEVRVAITPRWGMPRVGRITLVKPRLYGSYRGGTFSFGSLDKVLFTGSKEPFRLPDLDVAIEDGRGRLDSDWGPIGVKIDGAGALRDGFSGMLAAVAPDFDLAGCQGQGASLYGKACFGGREAAFHRPGAACGAFVSRQQAPPRQGGDAARYDA